MKLTPKKERQEARMRSAILDNYQLMDRDLYGDCDGCRTLAQAALEMAGWTLTQYHMAVAMQEVRRGDR